MNLSAALSGEELEFVSKNRSAAMITIGQGGMPKAVRVGVVVIDDKLWSSGTADRARTRRLRRDPRCTLFVFDPGYFWMSLETAVTILDGPDVPELSVRMFREMQGKPEGPLSWFGGDLDEDEFRQAMIDEQRLIYEFDVRRSYGMISMPT
jgi:PPOX class probable F420-dependent enzyme